MRTDVLVSVRLPRNVVELIDHLVKAGVVSCRSEALRLAVALKLKSLGYDVEPRKLDEVLDKLRSLGGLGR